MPIASVGCESSRLDLAAFFLRCSPWSLCDCWQDQVPHGQTLPGCFLVEAFFYDLLIAKRIIPEAMVDAMQALS